MRKILLAASALVMLASCKKYLDVNDNPNDATSSTPPLVLGQALVYAAGNTVSYNSYGAWMVGYTANAGGYGGWGSALNYNYGNTSYTGLWTSTYDNNTDFQYVIDQTEGDAYYTYYNAIARIMRAYNFQFLVDQYNDVPFTDALKGLGNLTPKYDNAKSIYKALYDEYTNAIELINGASGAASTSYALGQADPMFSGNMTKWKQFANTLKLRLLVRASATDAFAGVTPSFDAAGFLTEDAVVQPGYSKASGKQNPAWNAYHSSYTNGGAGRSLITTYFVVSFYNGSKISDINRAKAVYRGAQNPGRNQLGETDESIPQAPSGGPTWYSGNGSTYAFSDNYDNAVGVLKSRSMAQPILLAAESYFLQAEARLKGIISTSDVTTLFNSGITASFAYLFKSGDGTYKINAYFGATAPNPTALATAYHTEDDNATNYLVNIDLATTDAQKLEAIITQKYIALNMIHGHEAWAEFRRTGYPAIDNTPPLNAEATFVSILSAASTEDRLLGRVLYPNSEAQLNYNNMPTGITTSSLVFWDRRN